MSTFGGRMEEIDYISIDNFENENLKSKAFFLSHCHWDHMRGIDKREFECALLENNAYLYVSNVSKNILEKRWPYLTPRIKVLDIPGRNLIDIPNTDKTLSVTLIPAGHCPGSVMFLFECDKISLYTGDIRIRAKELQKFKDLYDSTGILKRIDHIYLDTTFFLKSYSYFPLREESITEFCDLINDWLMKSEQNIVIIETPANYGSEYLFIEIFKRCKQSIHVSRDKYNVCKNFPELDEAITLDKSKTRVYTDCRVIADDIPTSNKLTIKPSALCWRHMKEGNKIVETRGSTVHVCYSSHSSYSELVEILQFLKPLKISPSVLQKSEKDNEEMMDTIKEILEETVTEQQIDEEKSSLEEFANKVNWNISNCSFKSCSVDFDKENDEFFDFLNSPDSKRKKVE